RFSRDWSSDVCSSDLADVVDVKQLDVSQLEASDAQALARSLLVSFAGVLSPASFQERVDVLCTEANGNPLLLHELAQYMLDADQIGRASCRARVKVQV